MAMTTPKNKMQYPVIFKMEVLLASEDGRQLGTASGIHSLGDVPTEEAILTGLSSIPALLPEGFRLATPEEAYEYMCHEKGIGRVAIADCPKEWAQQTKIDRAMDIGRAAVKAAEAETSDEDDD